VGEEARVASDRSRLHLSQHIVDRTTHRLEGWAGTAASLRPVSRWPRSRRPKPRVRSPHSPGLPPAVVVQPSDSVRQLWMSRMRQCLDDVYAGVSLCKFPEDLRAYEHLMWSAAPQVVIEIGAYGGGSALWFRDRLRTLEAYGKVADPLVVSVELDPSPTIRALDGADAEWRSSIRLVAGDVRDPATAQRVAEVVPPGAAALVVEDSAHRYDTTWAALAHFSAFVQPEGFFVVEDGCVDIEELRLADDWPRGVLPALHDWLATEAGQGFRVRRDLELYGLSCSPEGFLQRLGCP
jgi:cephalosporin hydroxylase